MLAGPLLQNLPTFWKLNHHKAVLKPRPLFPHTRFRPTEVRLLFLITMALRRRRYRFDPLKIAEREIYIKAMCPAYAGVLCALTTLGAKPEGAALRHPRGQPPWERGQARRTPGEPVMGPRGVVKRERERERQDFLLMPCSAPPRPPKLESAPILAAILNIANTPGPTRRGATDSSRRNQPISRPDPSPPPRPAQIQPIISPHTAQSSIQDQIQIP